MNYLKKVDKVNQLRLEADRLYKEAFSDMMNDIFRVDYVYKLKTPTGKYDISDRVTVNGKKYKVQWIERDGKGQKIGLRKAK